MKIHSYKSAIGKLSIVASNSTIHSLHIGDDYPSDKNLEIGTNDLINRCIDQLDEYFSGKRTHFELPLDPQGTEFQKKVWNVLQKIPYGQTWTYKDEAISLGAPNACRAVGSANGKNPLPIIIPCHRVVASDGSLGGYSGGLSIKKKLLKIEGILFSLLLLLISSCSTNPTPKNEFENKVDKLHLYARVYSICMRDSIFSNGIIELVKKGYSDDINQSHFTNYYQKLINDENDEELQGLFRMYGWPGQTDYGNFNECIVQAAMNSRNTRFQKRVIENLEKGPHTTIPKNYLAVLMDRLLLNQDKPTRFGTQGECIRKRWVVIGVKTSYESINADRKAFNLMPIEESIRSSTMKICGGQVD